MDIVAALNTNTRLIGLISNDLLILGISYV